MNREIIKKKIRDIEISYDYHSYNNTYEVTVDLDTLASLIINIINENVLAKEVIEGQQIELLYDYSQQ